MQKLIGSRFSVLTILLIITAVILAINGGLHAKNNNYLIFVHSFSHLLDGSNLYILYPQQYFDVFKYGPTFAFFMAPFSLLPPIFGGVLWTLLNLGLLLFAISKMALTDRQKFYALLIMLPELIGSLQAFQTNILVAALGLIAWQWLEKRHILFACLLIAFLAHVKIFGGMLFLLLLFPAYHQNEYLKTFLKALFAGVVLAALPITAIGWKSLTQQYLNWLELLRADHQGSLGYSLMGTLSPWIGPINTFAFQISALIITCAIILWRRQTDVKGRWLTLVSLFYFFVVFNHKSESPTFIIPMVAFALDFQTWAGSLKVRTTALISTLFFVCFFSSDLCPKWIKEQIFHPYALKVWPFLILWPLALWRLQRHIARSIDAD